MLLVHFVVVVKFQGLSWVSQLLLLALSRDKKTSLFCKGCNYSRSVCDVITVFFFIEFQFLDLVCHVNDSKFTSIEFYLKSIRYCL
jgi:uncharacterized membrane protein